MKILRSNKRAHFDYTIEDTLDCGVVLEGHEVKECKLGHPRVNEAVAQFQEGEVRIVNMDIPLYENASHIQVGKYDAKRRRKLLITKQQRARLFAKTRKTNLVMVVVALLLSRGKIKVRLGLGTLKKKVMKKQSIKDKDTKRMMDRDISRAMKG